MSEWERKVRTLYDSVRVKGLLPHVRVVVGSDGCLLCESCREG